jgi:hypothetical protein
MSEFNGPSGFPAGRFVLAEVQAGEGAHRVLGD